MNQTTTKELKIGEYKPEVKTFKSFEELKAWLDNSNLNAENK